MEAGAPSGPDRRWIARWQPRFLEAEALVLLDLHGATAEQTARLRRTLAPLGAELVAVRNRSARALVRGTPLAPLEGEWAGQLGAVLARGRLDALRRAIAAWGSDRVRLVWCRGENMPLDALAPLYEPIPAEAPEGAWIGAVEDLRERSLRLRAHLRGPPAPLAADPGEPSLVLERAGPQRLAVMALLRRHLGYGLIEARRLVDDVPTRIVLRYRDEIEGLAAQLRRAGAEVTVPLSDTGSAEVALDAAALLAEVPPLRLREGFRLRGRAHWSPHGSHGTVWAESPGGLPLDPALALCGDGSPQSFAYASILLRELGDFAAEWHGVGWRAHEIVDSDDGRGWRWTDEGRAVRDLRPRVVAREDGSVEVMLCSASGLGGERLLAHLDRYTPPSLAPEPRAVLLATGGSGWVP